AAVPGDVVLLAEEEVGVFWVDFPPPRTPPRRPPSWSSSSSSSSLVSVCLVLDDDSLGEGLAVTAVLAELAAGVAASEELLDFPPPRIPPRRPPSWSSSSL